MLGLSGGSAVMNGIVTMKRIPIERNTGMPVLNTSLLSGTPTFDVREIYRSYGYIWPGAQPRSPLDRAGRS